MTLSPLPAPLPSFRTPAGKNYLLTFARELYSFVFLGAPRSIQIMSGFVNVSSTLPMPCMLLHTVHASARVLR